MKNDQPRTVPLSASAVAVLEALPRIGDQYVLTNNGDAPASAYSKNKARLDALLPSGMASWRLHDLRRTAATGMAKLGIRLPVIEKVINHSSGSFAGIVGVYQRHSFLEEKRHALDAWGAYVADLVADNRRARSFA